MMAKTKAYLSHSIRGKAGNKATDAEMSANNELASSVGAVLEDACPNLQLYVPGRLDAFLINQGVRPLDIVDALLEMDKCIVAHSDLLIVYARDGYISGGMAIEIDHAERLGVPVYYIGSASESVITVLNNIIDKRV